MHFDLSAIKSNPAKTEDGYVFATVELGSDDTAYHPYSGKAVYVGPGRIDYVIHPAAVYAYVDQTVTERKVK